MLRWLVNFGFLALPIGVTIGILLGLQAQRHATGGPPLFQPPDQPGGAPPVNNKLTYVQSCRKEDGIHPKVKDGYQEFTREFYRPVIQRNGPIVAQTRRWARIRAPSSRHVLAFGDPCSA